MNIVIKIIGLFIISTILSGCMVRSGYYGRPDYRRPYSSNSPYPNPNYYYQGGRNDRVIIVPSRDYQYDRGYRDHDYRGNGHRHHHHERW